MKKSELYILLVMGLLLIAPLSSASFTYYNHSILTEYKAGETVSGTITISFLNESASGKLTSTFGSGITLLDLLKRNDLVQDEDYTCTTTNCASTYTSTGSVSSFSMNENVTLGVRIEGSAINDLQKVSFKISSDAGPSCFSQVYVNVAQSGNLLTNTAHTNETCSSKNFGCFVSDIGSYTNALISHEDPYCMNITLPIAPAYRVGARITNSSSGSAPLFMQLRNISTGDLLKTCTLSPHASNTTEDLSCIIEYPSLAQQNYLVCIMQESSTSTNYLIRTETQTPVCGSDTGGASFSKDYEIFAQPLQFDSVSFVLNDTLFEEKYETTLSDFAYDYLENTYGSLDCQPYCIIPFGIYGISQNLQISDVSVRYKSGATQLTSSAIYQVSPKTPTISSEKITLSIAQAGFKIPQNATGSKIFDLYLNGNRVGNKLNFSIISAASFALSPLATVPGVVTDFNVISDFAVTRSSWDFGDGTQGTSTGKTATHAYTQPGTYTVKVTLMKQDGSSTTQAFSVRVATRTLSTLEELELQQKRLNNVSNSIARYDSWIVAQLREQLDLSTLNASLQVLWQQYNASTNASDLATQVHDLEIPESIITQKSGSLPLFVGIENSDPALIETLSALEQGLTGEERSQVKSAISEWMRVHYTVPVAFQVISQVVDGATTPLVTTFELTLTPTQESTVQPYLLISYPFEELTFKENYGQTELQSDSSSGTSLLVDSVKTISFSTKGEFSVADLGGYISPPLGFLGDNVVLCTVEDKCLPPRRGAKATWLIILVAFAAFVTYIILQEWYKRHYEAHLFKQSSDLYNIINFIYNARVTGLSDDAIRAKLAATGWTNEQESYAFKKIDGRRTGMYEIPIFKFLEQRKVKQELAKRQQKPVDVRFIKRPSQRSL